MSACERSEILSEIKTRLKSISAVAKRNGTIKSGEDVRDVYREFGVPINPEEEKSIRSFKIAAN